jgi:PIN domain nuclease of toxin-antitoxin system
MILLDTHIWIQWIIQGDEALPVNIAKAIQDADEVAVSAISCWEVVLLSERRRIELPIETDAWVAKALEPAGINCIPISCEIARKAAELPEHHKDPADRLIIATALVHNADLASLDKQFPRYQEIAPCLLST